MAPAFDPGASGITSTWPTLICVGSEMPLACAIALTLVPNRAAMAYNVSPACTV